MNQRRSRRKRKRRKLEREREREREANGREALRRRKCRHLTTGFKSHHVVRCILYLISARGSRK